MSKKRQRRAFTDEFKSDAIKLVIEQGYSCNEAARRLGIGSSNLARWVRDHRAQLDKQTASGSNQEKNKEQVLI